MRDDLDIRQLFDFTYILIIGIYCQSKFFIGAYENSDAPNRGGYSTDRNNGKSRFGDIAVGND